MGALLERWPGPSAAGCVAADWAHACGRAASAVGGDAAVLLRALSGDVGSVNRLVRASGGGWEDALRATALFVATARGGGLASELQSLVAALQQEWGDAGPARVLAGALESGVEPLLSALDESGAPTWLRAAALYLLRCCSVVRAAAALDGASLRAGTP